MGSGSGDLRMAPSQAAGVRFNLILLTLVSSFLACAFLVWERRAPWHVVATVTGHLPPEESQVPYVFDPENGTLYFADTRELYELPPDYRGKMEIQDFHPSRTSFTFTTEEPGGGVRRRCWNMAAHREVSIPDYGRASWRLSASGTRILIEDVQPESPRRFQVLGLDGSVLHERVLPALDDRSSDAQHDFSTEGRFLIVTFADSRRVHLTLIYDMESQESWPFADRFAALSEEGVVWLKDAGSVIDRSYSEILRAVRLRNGEELWRTEVPEGVSDVVYLGRDRLAVGSPGTTTSVVISEALSGRR